MFKRILYGGDYNPEQWPKETWGEDLEIFKDAHINSATVNVFSWARLQPSENEYCFDELDSIVEKLSKEGYDIVLATSTAALPAWLFKTYPEVARVDHEGRKHKFGQRHNACPNSPVYQGYAQKLVSKLAERYNNSSHVVCWHINNEYGGECFCENCEKAFRVWLKEKYKTLDVLNEAWNTAFWGHTLYAWDEIVLPNTLSEEISAEGIGSEGIGARQTCFQGISLDYKRFNSDSLLANFKMERDIIKSWDSQTPVTTNLMGTYKPLDYFKWAKEMDIVSWDNYPAYNTPWSMVAMTHDLMRGLKNQPFMLMEQTPSQQNWQPYNSLKKPGQMRAQSYQTLAHGGDTIQFFQLKRSKGACEKFHGAVIEHVGHKDTRVFREVAELGKELEGLTEIIGSQNISEVGLLFDWDNYWALESTSGPNQDLKYVSQIHQYYRYFYEKNISVDLLPVDADFMSYKVIVAPVLYMMKPGMKEALEAFVLNGGRLVTTFMSGIVDQSDNVHLGGYPGPLRELAGVWVEEIDALGPEQKNRFQFENGGEGETTLLSDVIHLEDATSLAHYTNNFYAGMPVVTQNTFGRGQTYYVGAELDRSSLGIVLDQVCESATVVSSIDEATSLEIMKRTIDDTDYYFIINFEDEEVPLPKTFDGTVDLLTGKTLSSSERLLKYTTYVAKM